MKTAKELESGATMVTTEKSLDPNKEGLDNEKLYALMAKVNDLIKDEPLCSIIVLQGEGAATVATNGNILPTHAMHAMQLINVGVFSGATDADERQVLDAVSMSIARKLNAEDEIPKIIIN